MGFESWNSYGEFSRATQHRNRYIHDADVWSFLADVLETSRERERTIKVGRVLWRAQLGHDWQPIILAGEEWDEIPCPYPPKRMKPIPYFASEGRANPKGIPYLYLATDKETAMSEVRPWLGSSISVGQFKTTKELHVIDCSVRHASSTIFYFEEPNEEKRKVSVWSNIDKAFAKPINPSDKVSDYVPTQILAELFKSKGYDGIVYKSALSTRFNLALFDLEFAELINCSLYEVKSIDFQFEEVASPCFVRPEEDSEET